MYFRIIGKVTGQSLIAKGRGIRRLSILRQKYGPGNWKKMKGVARVRLTDGANRLAEVHWYEAHGIGPKDYKIKKFLD